jgi:acetyl esterase
MATIPRTPPAVEHRVLKAVCGLPPRVQRRLFGPLPEIDGQVLAPDTQALLWVAKLVGTTSFTGGMPVAEARIANQVSAMAMGARPPIPMASVEDLTVPGEAGPLPCRLYVPPRLQAGSAAPLLLFFHGGGWVIGGLDTHDDACRFLAAAAGTVVLSLDYRLSPEHPFPAAVEDAWSGFAWAVDNAASIGVDPERIAVGGDSSGANLAAVVSLMARTGGSAMPAMQLLFYPPTDAAADLPSRRLFAHGFLLTKDDMDSWQGHYLPPGTDVTDTRASILLTPDLSGLPPAYVSTAGFDPLRDEAEAYALRMREAGVKVALRRHPGLIHSFVNHTAVSRTARGAMLEAAGALRMGLAPASR